MDKHNIYHWKKCLLSIFILLVCIMIYTPSSRANNLNILSEKISLNLDKVTLKEAFHRIESKSDITFMYDAASLDLNRLVSVNAKNKSIESILDDMFKNTDIGYEVVDKQVIIASKKALASQQGITQQSRSIRGTILDSNGEAIVGASIKIKGTGRGTISDIDGSFSLEVSPSDILEVSFLGYSTQNIAVENKPSLNILLREDPKALEEVIVVGYGTQRRIHVTGSVAQVSAEDLVKAPMPSITNMLAGKLPGLITTQSSGQPGADQSAMFVRGMGTFGDSSPLILVDGVERSFNTIDPNDVESVSILKDAASAAVYGVRAAHGVILVKTKRGSSEGKTTATYRGSYTFSTNTRFPEFLNGPDYAKWHNRARELDGNQGYYSDEEIERMTNGDPTGMLGSTNWPNLLFKDFGGTQQHNISVTGGNEKVQYFVSGGFMDQEGIIPNTDFERYNIRSNIDIQATKELKLSVDISGRLEDKNAPGYSLSPNSGYSPITQSIRALPVIPQKYNGMYTATGENASTWNPIAAVYESGFNQSDRSLFESSAVLEYKTPFIDGLTLKMFFSFDRNFTETQNFLTTYNVNKYNPATNTYAVTKADGTGENSLFQSASSGQIMMSRPSIEYHKVFGAHDIGALFLYEFRQTNGRNLQAAKRSYSLTDLPELSQGQEVSPNSVTSSSDETRIAGYVGRLNYIYNNKYLAEFAFRYDGSYKFLPEYRWGFFPSLSVGWIISEEDFFKDKFSNIEKLKVRASVGELGKDNIDGYLYARFFKLTDGPAYAYGISPKEAYALYTLNSIPSYTLTWEKTRSANLGFEFMAWKGLLSVDLDLFYKYTYDILQGVGGVYPPSLANNFATIANSGEVAVKGFELVVSHRNTIGEVSYGLSGNLTLAKNKVLSRTQNENIPSWQNVIGQPIGTVYGFHATGLYQTEDQLINRPTGPGGVQRLGDLMYEDVNGDGKIDYNDQIAIARSHTPEMVFSFTMNAEWKGLDFTAQFQGAGLCDVITSGLYPNGIMDQTEFARAFYGGGNSPYYLVEGSWTPENTNAKYPRLGEAWNGNNGWTSDWWVVDGTYLRLKNAQIGYTVPRRWIDKIHAQRLRVYIAGTNLFTLDKLDFMDPEMPSNNNGYYPQQRTYSIGLDLTF